MHRKKLINNVLWLIILFWVGIATVYWNLGPGIANRADASLTISLLLLMKGASSVGLDLLVILLGYFYRQNTNKEKTFISGWLITWSLGLIIGLIVACSTTSVWYSTYSPTIYKAAFPIISNSYPLIFGSLLGLLLIGLLQKLNDKELARYLNWGIWTMLTLSFFNPANIWGWNDPYLVIFYALLTVLGHNLADLKLPAKKGLLAGLGLGIVYALILLVLPRLLTNGDVFNHMDGVTNLLAILTAFMIGRFLINYTQAPNLSRIIAFITVIASPSITIVLLTLENNHISHSSTIVAVITIIYAAAALLLVWLLDQLSKLSCMQKLDQGLDKFTKLPLIQQREIVIKRLKASRPNLFIFIVSYLITAFSMLLMYAGDFSKLDLKEFFFDRQINLLFATLFTFMTVKLLEVISKRYWTSLIIVFAVNAVIVVANIEKIKSRSEPIVPSDMKLVGVAKDIFGMVDPTVWLYAGLGLIVLIIVTILLEKKFSIRYHAKRANKIVITIFTILLFASSLVWNHTNTPISNFLFSIGDDKQFFDQLNGARINSPVVQFLNNMDITVMEQPKRYSKATMVKLHQKYMKEASQINVHRTNHFQDQNVVFILSESLANPNRVPGLKLTANPLAYIDQLKQENTGGLMISPGYGGGTANIEFMALTGFSMSNFSPTLAMPYTQLVTNLAKFPAFNGNFPYSAAIHPYIGSFYNRIGVYKKFGFNRFYHLDSKQYPIKHQKKIENSPAQSDYTSYQNIIDQLNRHHGPQFIQVATMQNHMPYDQHYYKTNPQYKAVKVPAGVQKGSVDDYTAAIHYTDKETKQFIKQLDRINKPITVVLYGDHLPGIYGNPTAKNSLKLHETDYFIYSNKYARQHGSRNLSKKESAVVSPNDFIAMAAQQTNSKVDWYQALLTDIYQDVPVFNKAQNHGFNPSTNNSSSQQIVSRQGKLMKYSQLTKKQKRIYHDYQLVQYDITAGKHYLVNNMK